MTGLGVVLNTRVVLLTPVLLGYLQCEEQSHDESEGREWPSVGGQVHYHTS